MKPISVLWTTYFLILGMTSTTSKGDLKKVRPLALVVLSDNDSHIQTPTLMRVTTVEEWEQVWEGHAGVQNVSFYSVYPRVNFERCMVVAIFYGPTVHHIRLHVDSVSETEKEIRIRFHNLWYSTGRVVHGDIRDTKSVLAQAEEELKKIPRDYPYAFVILEKSDKAIVVEEGEKSGKEEPPSIWKEWKRLDALPTDKNRNVDTPSERGEP